MSHCHPRWPSPHLPGDPPFWDERGDESQLLVQRCGQPHGFHPDQNQRPQWGPVHHPPCRGGSHIRCASKSLSVGLFLILSFFSCTLNVFLCCFLAAPGIYSSTEMLDFGTLRSQGKDMLQFFSGAVFLWASLLTLPLLSFPHRPTDRPKLLNLHLLNSGTKDVPITVGILCSGPFLKSFKSLPQPCNPILYLCFTECSHNTIKRSSHNRFQSSHSKGWREQIYQSCKY